MANRVYDDKFKAMAVELSNEKGSVKEAAGELGITADILAKWRGLTKSAEPISKTGVPLTEEQKQIKRLEKELKESNLEREILKKAVHIFFGGTTGDIRVYKRT